MNTTTDARAPLAEVARNRWTPEEDEILLREYPHRSSQDVAKMLPRHSIASCRQRAHKFGVHRDEASLYAERSGRFRLVRTMPKRGDDAKWTPPGPRYPSVWAMAQGVTV